MTTANRSKIVYRASGRPLNDASTLAETSLHGLRSALHELKLTARDKIASASHLWPDCYWDAGRPKKVLRCGGTRRRAGRSGLYLPTD